ncbi:DNA polymerase-3 subunit alpha [Bacillus ectoiniformans]|nr:DNA polymerase-3 subunit alpha [Bacillus ectoiniformans]
MYVHLQIQTGYSLLKSPISVDKLVHKGKQLGYEAMAITDHNVMYGAIPFYKACKKAGMKPIIGLTADVKSEYDEGKTYPLILLAKNNTGYHHLLKISSVIQTKAKDGIPVKWLKGYSEGLIALTPGIGGEIESLIQENRTDQAEEAAHFYKQLFGTGNFYLSMQRHGRKEEESIEAKIMKVGESASIPIAATHQVMYLDQEEAFARQCLAAIGDGVKLSDIQMDQNDRYYLTSKQEMAELFSDRPEMLEQTLKISGLCDIDISFHNKLLPKFPLPKGKTADEYLLELCIHGLKEEGLDHLPQYQERLKYELSVIGRMGFSDYFLIVWDFMTFARNQHILTGPGRGSAAGSLVAYALKITDVDPLKYHLLFERFLNPDRVSMPDIDLDFPDHRRDEVISYIAEKYGALHAAQIVTFGTLSAKAVMRDVARVFGFGTKELEQLSRMLPAKLGLTLNKAYEESDTLRRWVQESKQNERLFQTALTLEGLPRHTSTHAAGMVITEQPLTDLIAIGEGHDGIFLTQFPMDTLEELGLLKIDLLGLRNLTILERIIESVYYSEGKRIQLKDIPFDDEQTFRLLSAGQTTGIFQLESDGMRKVLMRLKPNHFEDIVAVNALYRPGPMENIPFYIERKHGLKPVEYPHPDLEEILKSTYGVLIYQEQIMQIASKMAGFSLGEADLLRRAVSKKKREVLDEERKHFVSGARANGYSKETAEKMYDLIVQFANYGFNRSHAVAYSFIAYHLSYLKAHYPKNFMAALLSSAIGNPDKVSQYIAEAKLMNVELLPPSINKSHIPFKAEKQGIRYSLAAIKGMGSSVLKAILEARKDRPFADLFDFCIRVPLKIVNRKSMESLVFSGAFDDFSQDRAVLLASLDVAIDHAELVKPDEDSFDLFMEDDFFPKPKYVEVDPMKEEDLLAFEKEVLGLYLSSHPTEPYQPLFKSMGGKQVADILSDSRKKASSGAFLSEVKAIRTKKGENMAFITFSDGSAEMEGVIFPNVYRKVSLLLKKGEVLWLTGESEERNGQKQFIVESVVTLEELKKQSQEKQMILYLKIPDSPDEHLVLADVHKVLSRYKGQTPVVMHYERTRQTIQLRESKWVKPSEACLSELEEILTKDCIVLKSP